MRKREFRNKLCDSLNEKFASQIPAYRVRKGKVGMHHLLQTLKGIADRGRIAETGRGGEVCFEGIFVECRAELTLALVTAGVFHFLDEWGEASGI